MISMAIRSCGVWTNGTTSRVCSGMASRFWLIVHYFFFFNDTAPTEIYTAQYTLSLHDALPISRDARAVAPVRADAGGESPGGRGGASQQHLRLTRSRAPLRQRRVRLQRSRPDGLSLPIREGRLSPVPWQAAQREGLSLGHRGREARRTSLAARGRLAPELRAQHQVRRRGGGTQEGRAPGRGEVSVDAGAVGRAIRPHHDRGAVLGNARTRHTPRRAARSDCTGRGCLVRHGG